MYGIIYWQQLTFRRALPSAISSPLSHFASTPGGDLVSLDTSPHRCSLPLLFFVAVHLPFIPHASFFPLDCQRTRSLSSFHLSLAPNFLIPSLFLVVTNKSKLSPAEKNARRFPEQRKAGFLDVICGNRSLNSQHQ